MSSNASDLLSISVLSEVDGKKYKILVKETNFNKLKVEDIKKNLQGITGLSPSDQDISINGALLSDSWTAVDFGLHPFCQLTLSSKFHKNNNKATSKQDYMQSQETKHNADNKQLPNPDNMSKSPPNSFRNESKSSPSGNMRGERTQNRGKAQNSDYITKSPSHSFEGSLMKSPSNSFSNETQPQAQTKPSTITPRKHMAVDGTGRDEEVSSKSIYNYSQQAHNLIPLEEHEKILSETILQWKHRVNNETRKFLEEKKGLLKSANQDREHLLNENHKLRAMLGDGDLVAVANQSQSNSGDSFSIQEKHHLEEQLNILQSHFRKVENEKYELARKLAEEKEISYKMQTKYGEEQKILLSSFVDEKNKMLKTFSQEKEDWIENFRSKLSQVSSAGTHQSNSANASPDFALVVENNKWEVEKALLLKNWSEETDVLTMIYETEKRKWMAEKEELLRIFDEERKSWTDQACFSTSVLENQIQQLQQALKASKEREEQLQVRVAQVRRVADERALIAQASQRSLEELKDTLAAVSDGSIAVAQAVVTATSQKNIEIQKVQRLLYENDHVSTRVREEVMLRNLLSDKLDDILGRIRIVCRCRPLLSAEASNEISPSLVAGDAVVECKGNQVIIKSGLVSLDVPQVFNFSSILGPRATQRDAYDEVLSFVQSFCDGHNVLIAGFGPTGSGKSYSLFGGADPSTAGIIPRSIEQIFAILQHTTPAFPTFSHPHASHSLPPTYEWFLDCNVIELFSDEIFDLLSGTPDKPILNFQLSRTTKLAFKNQSEIQRVLSAIGKKRQIPGTSISPRTAQSHLMVVLQLRPESVEYDEFNNKEFISISGDVPSSKLVFLDLAGAEYMTGTFNDTTSQKIKGDLISLGDIIQKLNRRESLESTKAPTSFVAALNDCIPFDAKSKLLLFAHITPSSIDLSRTVHTLDFATKLKSCDTDCKNI